MTTVKYPAPIAFSVQTLEQETEITRKNICLMDIFETLVKFMSFLFIQSFYEERLHKIYPELDREIRRNIQKPTQGTWIWLLRNTAKCFENQQNRLLDPELFAYSLEIGKVEKILLDFRNEFSHTRLASVEKEKRRFEEYHPLIRDLLEKGEFLSKFELRYADSNSRIVLFNYPKKLYIDNSDFLTLPPLHVVAYHTETGKFLDLHPLIVVKESIKSSEMRLDEIIVLIYDKLENPIKYMDLWEGEITQYPDFTNEFINRFRQKSANWFEDLIFDRSQNFIGRKDALDRIDLFINASSKPALIVYGAPGMGKSSLLCKWAHVNEDSLVLRHFFQEGDGSTLSPRELFDNLTNQLLERLEISPSKKNGNKPGDLAKVFNDTLQIAAKKSKITIILDGLDEVINNFDQGWESPDQIIDLLPQPVKGVKLIISTQNTILERPAFNKRFGKDKAVHYRLEKLSNDDIQELLYHLHNKYETIASKDFIQNIILLSEGNPLYLRLFIEELNNGHLTTNEINSLPFGITGYYERILNRIKNSSISENVLSGIRLLALHCLVKAPISLQIACEIFEITPSNGQILFNSIRTLLSELHDGFTVFHSSFRNYFLHMHEYVDSHLNTFEPDIRFTTEKLLNYCAKWDETQSKYSLRYYPIHLYESITVDRSNLETLYSLAKNEDFRTLQRKVFPDEINLPLISIRNALLGAIADRDILRMVEFSLKHANEVFALNSESPLDAFRSGSIHRARILIENDQANKFNWYLLLSWELKEIDDIEAAKQLLVDIIDNKIFSEREDKLISLISLNLEDLIDVSWPKDEYLILQKNNERLLSFIQNCGLDQKRLTIGSNQEVLRPKSRLEWENIIKTNKPYLLKEFENIGPGWGIGYQICLIALKELGAEEQLTLNQLLRRAYQKAIAVEDQQYQFKFRNYIAHLQAIIGCVSDALETIQGVDIYRGGDAFSEIGMNLVLSGQAEQAIDIILEIPTVDARRSCLIDLAIACVLMNDNFTAREILALAIQQSHDQTVTSCKSYVMTKLMEIQYDLDQYDEFEEYKQIAIDLALKLKDPDPKMHLLNKIGTMLAKKVDLFDADEVFDLSLSIAADEILDNGQREFAWIKIIEAQIEGGYIAAAEELAEEMSDFGYYQVAFRKIIDAYIDKGDEAYALSLLDNFAFNNSFIPALDDLVVEKAREQFSQYIQKRLTDLSVKTSGWQSSVKENCRVALANFSRNRPLALKSFSEAINTLGQSPNSQKYHIFKLVVETGIKCGFITEILEITNKYGFDDLGFIAEIEDFSQEYKSHIGTFLMKSLNDPRTTYTYIAQLAKAYPEYVDEIARYVCQ